MHNLYENSMNRKVADEKMYFDQKQALERNTLVQAIEHVQQIRHNEKHQTNQQNFERITGQSGKYKSKHNPNTTLANFCLQSGKDLTEPKYGMSTSIYSNNLFPNILQSTMMSNESTFQKT